MSAQSSRTTRADWLAAGLELLRTGGGDALTLDRLCLAVKRTKGAFYHHFSDISAYHEALLAHWVHSHTEQLIADAEGASAQRTRDAATFRRQALYRAVSQVDIGVELAIQAWSLRAANARAAVAKVHARRIAYLARLRPASESRARDAELEYAIFIGALHLYPDPSDAPQRRRLQRALGDLLSDGQRRKTARRS
ncbi:MAG: TetR/AcrR family transcriptional regulator [Myxococcota bacterium]